MTGSTGYTEQLNRMAGQITEIVSRVENQRDDLLEADFKGQGFIADLPDRPFEPLGLAWVDGFGFVREWRRGDPLPSGDAP